MNETVFKGSTVELTKDGYATVLAPLDKEVAVGPLLAGVLLCPVACLWFMQPRDAYFFNLAELQAPIGKPTATPAPVPTEPTSAE